MSPGPIANSDSIGVAGGGIIGLSLAWRLAEQGWDVTVFDSGTIGREASWAGAGMLACGGEFETASDFTTLALESRALYREFVSELERASGLQIDYQECGGLELAYSPDEFELLETKAVAQNALGIRSKPVAPADVASFWPRVQSDRLTGARFYPDDGIVNSREVLAALQAACRRSNVRLLADCGVRAIEIAGAEVTLVSSQGRDTHAAAVIAAGAWSGSIEVTGAPALPSSEPVKGHLIGYWQPEKTCSTIVRHGHLYLLQRANGLLIAGSTLEHVGFDRHINPETVASLAAQASCVLPHLAETTPSEAWIGFRPQSDCVHMGAWHSPRLYLAYGHYRNGILLAPVTARRLAAEISANLRKP